MVLLLLTKSKSQAFASRSFQGAPTIAQYLTQD